MTYALRFSTPIMATFLVFSATGCLVGGDSSEPVLAVDLYWDENPRADRFSGGTCDTAGVSWMEWQLVDASGKEVIASEKGGVPCEDGFNFKNVNPGTYKLVLSGFDDQDAKLWSSTCKNLELDRFDQLYSCDIDQ